MPTIKPIARPYWSGVEKLDFDFPKSELTRLVELIPVPKQLNETETQSRCNRISIKLIELGTVSRVIPCLAMLVSGLLAFAVPLYWKHLDNCSLRCEQKIWQR